MRKSRTLDPEKSRQAVRAYVERNRQVINKRTRDKRAANPEKFRSKERSRRLADPEKFRERARNARHEDPKRFRQYASKKYASQRDAILDRLRIKRSKHREEYNAKHREWVAANWQKIVTSRAAWKAANPEKWKEQNHTRATNRRARVLNAVGSFTTADWRTLVARSPHCHWCGRKFTKSVRRTHDHVRPLSKGGVNTIENSVCACNECNVRKQAGHFNPANGQGILL